MVEGLAIDWLHSLIYWVESHQEARSISVANLNGKYSHSILTFHSHIPSSHSILTFHAHIPYSHSMLTFHAHIPYSHSMLTVNLYYAHNYTHN